MRCYELNVDNEIKTRINETENLLNKITDTSTMAYLNGAYKLKCDYETIGDMENACKYASIVIYLLSHNITKYERNPSNNELINNIWVKSYDTKARNGHFESFCIAMEWNRPIHKQFYLPRAKYKVYKI